MKILNLYAGIGGNRKLWGKEHKVTAVENNKHLCKVYKKLFSNDEVICGDAIEYLERNFHKFDFIWASPSCLTHTRMNIINAGVRYNNKNMTLKVPDMKLYGLIIFLEKIFRGEYVVENVIPYYKPLITPNIKLGRHYFWSNLQIEEKRFIETFYNMNNHKNDKVEELAKYHNYNLEELKSETFKGITLKKALKNAVKEEIGRYILDCSSKTNKEDLK